MFPDEIVVDRHVILRHRQARECCHDESMVRKEMNM